MCQRPRGGPHLHAGGREHELKQNVAQALAWLSRLSVADNYFDELVPDYTSC